MTFKPMLAATVNDVSKLVFPLKASPKLDGIRAVVIDGQLLSRSLKPIPNRHLQKMFGKEKFNGVDGELIMGMPNGKDVFRNTSSAVMSYEGEPRVGFHLFDMVMPNPFESRIDTLYSMVKKLGKSDPMIQLVEQTTVRSVKELDEYEELALQTGFEGVMLRSLDGKYKYGRSTLKEHGLMKLKRFEDAEARVVGFNELMHNSNEAVTSKLGHKERSSVKSGLSGMETLGSIIVVGINGPYKGVKFSIGTGFDDATRLHIWNNQKTWLDSIVKYKYFPTGSKVAPRFPVFLGVRDKKDL